MALARSGFNDDINSLPIDGSIKLMLLSITMKVDLYTIYLQGYLIASVIKMVTKLMVDPYKIEIEDFIAQ